MPSRRETASLGGQGKTWETEPTSASSAELAGYVGAELPAHPWDQRPTLRLARGRNALCKVPEVGVHIDVSRKTVGAWQTADTMGFFLALPEVWSGWHTECWEDRFEEQVLRCNGALRVPELDWVAGIDNAQTWIRDRVFQSFADSPAGQIVKLAELLAPVGPGLVVSDDALDAGAVRPRKLSGRASSTHATCCAPPTPNQPD